MKSLAFLLTDKDCFLKEEWWIMKMLWVLTNWRKIWWFSWLQIDSKLSRKKRGITLMRRATFQTWFLIFCRNRPIFDEIDDWDFKELLVDCWQILDWTRDNLPKFWPRIFIHYKDYWILVPHLTLISLNLKMYTFSTDQRDHFKLENGLTWKTL